MRVPASNLLGEEGDGFRIAQERLGPGRIHHAMRAIGMAERALELMCERTASRSTFGRPIIDHGVVQRWIAEARVKIEQARLLVLKTAWLMDTVGNRGARIEVSAIKVAAPEVATWVIDRAIQAHGGMGVARTPCCRSSTRSPASSRSPTGPTRSTTWRSRGARRAATGSSRFTA